MPSPGDAGPTDPAVTDNSGAARFRIPIAVPPGPGGFAPNIEFAYSSRSGDGPFGVGWKLGIPEIHCSARFGVPDFANCAKFELGGVLLVEDPGTANEYHTFVESFQRIRFDPTNDTWTVEQPNGIKLIFGEDANHRVSQGGFSARWLLQRMVDSFGNSIYFEYDTSTDVGSAYLVSVTYGVGATPASGPREVRFVYESRPDARHIFTGGIERKITLRLRETRVLGHGEAFRRYVFGYELPGTPYTTDRSRLSWVREFGTDCSDLGVDPVANNCAGLPTQKFVYRDANDIASSGTGSQWDGSNDDYRIPFGTYTNRNDYRVRQSIPQLIGDINGDGLPDRLELLFLDHKNFPGVPRVQINTGSGFSDTDASAVAYQVSFENLTYAQPRLDYQQIPAPITFPPGLEYRNFHWDPSTFAMCSVTPTTRLATLSEELLNRGIGVSTSSLADLQASEGNPSAGFIEPRPSIKLVDLDSDGLADLVLSVRLSGVKRHFDCDGTELATPEEFAAATSTVVFRNTGSGWVNDTAAQALADGLPPFEEVIVKSSYQAETDTPTPFDNEDSAWGFAPNSCANSNYNGFEWALYNLSENSTAVCHVPIDLSPRFVDFNGDGLLDLAVLQRDDPDRLWTGDGWWFGEANNMARTRIWIQQPNASSRWVRAPQYDLPVNIWPTLPEEILGFSHMELSHVALPETYGSNCKSWSPDVYFWDCGPGTYTRDMGVRFADVNGDGLTDVVWKGPFGGAGGVLLNTGFGSNPFSAWCASDAEDALLVGGACPEAAAYIPPTEIVKMEALEGGPSMFGMATGLFADLNGDGSLDFVKFRTLLGPVEAWIQSPAGGTAASVWQRDERFDFPVDWERDVPYPHPDFSVIQHAGIGAWGYIPAFQLFDVNGDGTADFVGDQHAFLSKSRHSDLMRSVDNGRGGLVEVEYDSMILQRDSSLEVAAEPDPLSEVPDGGDATLWRPSPVVSRIRVAGLNFEDAITDYKYARPRFCTGLRSDLGFRMVERTRPDLSTVEEYFYQDHGRAGQTSERLVKAGGEVVHRYEARWDLVNAAIPGTILNVFLGRLAWDERANEYGGEPGALLKRIFEYDDQHGYNFVSTIRTERPTGTLVETREPASLSTDPFIAGRVAARGLYDDSMATQRLTTFTYVDLDLDESGPKIGSRSEFVAERGASGSHWVDVVKYRYDIYGNIIEEQTPNPDPIGGIRSTLHCYDGDGGWCPSPYGHSSHSIEVATKDPLGNVTRMTPDARSGIILAVDSDYTDQPAARTTLDPFGRPEFEYVTPNGGSEVQTAMYVYDDANGPLRVERFQYVDEAGIDPIYSAEIFGSFGGPWKAIAETPSGFVGTMTYSDPEVSLVRTTLPIDCGQDATCDLFAGDVQAAAVEAESDALGRPIRVDTPDGFSILAYGRVIDQWGSASLDHVFEKNAKGDLTQRALDGDRPVWVDECHLGTGAGVASLDGVTCGAADTTRYTYEPLGENRAIYDARAVASSNFNDPNHRLWYTYDTLGRVTRIEDPDLEGSGYSLTAYADAGVVESTTNARGQSRSFTYDALGRLTGVTTPSGEDDYTVTYRTSELQREKDSSTAYERVRTYDGFGRVEQAKLSVKEAGGVAGWSGIYLTDTTFDLVGRPVEITHPESTVVRYEYEGAYLKRVCDLGTAADCLDSTVVNFVSDVMYDALGRRTTTTGAAGARTFAYDGSLARLTQDRFVGSSDPYWFERNYDSYDELGNLQNVTGASLPGDIDLNESYVYDTRNRIYSWTKEGASHAYGYDDLGNLTLHAGNTQVFDDADRPHAIKTRVSGGASYAYDDDGNVASIVGTGGSQYFTFDSANRLICIDTVEGGCAVSRIHYDVDGRRVLDDKPGLTDYLAYVDESVTVERDFNLATHIEIQAFGERIAYKNSKEDFRQAVVVPFNLPPEVLHFLLGVGLLGLLGWLARRGALVLVLERPAQAGLAATLVVTLVFLPVPVNDAKAGGGGSSTFYWELADRLGTGMVMLDETGARVVHRTSSPFGAEYASAGDGGWLPSHYGGHRKDEDSGLVYMQARWMDPNAGIFISVDPVVANPFDPQSANAYAYARNNPISNIDPTGMCVIVSHCYSVSYGLVQGQSPSGASSNSGGNSIAVNLGKFGIIEEPGADSFSGGDSGSTWTSTGGGSGTLTVYGNRSGFQGSQFSYWNGTYSVNATGIMHQNLTVVATQGLGGGSLLNQTISSGAAIGAYGEFSRVQGGQWLGKNNVWYSLLWGGNGATGARSAVTQRAAQFRALNRSIAALQATIGAVEMVTGDTPFDRLSGALDVGLVGVSLTMGLPGLGISVGLGLVGFRLEHAVEGFGRLTEAIINSGPNGSSR